MGLPAAGAHGQGAFQSSSETRRLRAGAGRIGPLSGLAGGAEPHLAFPSDHQAVALRTQATLASGLCRCGLEAAPALRPPPSGSYVHQTDRWHASRFCLRLRGRENAGPGAEAFPSVLRGPSSLE